MFIYVLDILKTPYIAEVYINVSITLRTDMDQVRHFLHSYCDH